MSGITPAVVFASLLALALEWFPGLAGRWQLLTPARRTTINAFSVAIISIVAMLIGCRRGTACPADVWGAIGGFLLTALLALGANQATYLAARRQNFGLR